MGEFRSILGKVAGEGQFSITEIASLHSKAFGWTLSQRREDCVWQTGHFPLPYYSFVCSQYTLFPWKLVFCVHSSVLARKVRWITVLQCLQWRGNIGDKLENYKHFVLHGVFSFAWEGVLWLQKTQNWVVSDDSWRNVYTITELRRKKMNVVAGQRTEIRHLGKKAHNSNWKGEAKA